MGWEFEQLVLGDSARVAYKPYPLTSFRSRGKSWYKADFDGNGWPDLLVLGRKKTTPFVFCVLDSGNNRLRVVRHFYNALDERQPNAKVVYKHGQALLHYTAFARRRGPRGGLAQRQTRLLAYRQGCFVPYERHPTTHRIESISYKSYFNYRGIYKTEVQIDSAGLATLTTQTTARNDSIAITRHARRQLSPDTQKALVDLLNYVHFATYSSPYGIHTGGHRPYFDLRVTCKGGANEIHETGGRNNLGMGHVYRYLEALAAP